MRPGVVLALLSGTCLLLATVLALVPRGVPEPQPAPAPVAPTTPRPPPAAREEPAEVAVTSKTAKVLGRLCLVIDDVGYSLDDLEAFLDIPGEITIAVIPGLPNSAEAARRAREAGKTVFLHAPMEPEGEEDPGPDAIRTDMSELDVRRTLGRWLDEVGPVAGVNNHMGSRATTDIGTVRSVLSVARERKLIFLDSRTTARSLVVAEGERQGVPIAERDVFLDDEPGLGPVRDGMEKAKEIARRRGYALAIGHVRNRSLAAYLERTIPALVEEGYVLVSPAEIARLRVASP